MRLFQLMFCNTIPSARCRAMGGFSVVGEPNIQRTVVCIELSVLVTHLNSKVTKTPPEPKLCANEDKSVISALCSNLPLISVAGDK